MRENRGKDERREEIEFNSLSKEQFEEKCLFNGMEGNVYRNVFEILNEFENQEEIRAQFPHPKLERRNTGYAIDVLLESEPFTQGKSWFNFS